MVFVQGRDDECLEFNKLRENSGTRQTYIVGNVIVWLWLIALQVGDFDICGVLSSSGLFVRACMHLLTTHEHVCISCNATIYGSYRKLYSDIVSSCYNYTKRNELCVFHHIFFLTIPQM